MSKPFNPESTTFTNLALDKIMPRVSPNAWKILCLAIRKTAGWKDDTTESGRKESDVISVSQFMEYCGMSNKTAISAINECIEKGYLLRIREDRSFRYSLNLDYELPDECNNYIPRSVESTLHEVKNLHTQTISINSNVNLNIEQDNFQEIKGDPMNAEEYKKKIENSLAIGLANHFGAYSHFPERIRPVVEKMEKYWYFKAPTSSKSKQYSFWIQSCDEILDGCDKFGVALLDSLYDDWRAFLDSNEGKPPYSVSSPKSLVNAVLGKAALMRSGNNVPFWKVDKSKVKQTMLDI